MKNTDQSTVSSIYPDDPGHGVTREKFAKLILAEDLTKIEEAINLSSRPSEGFRRSVISFLWAFYNNSLPQAAEIKVSRKALREELEKATKHARALEKSATRIWSSGDYTVLAELHEFVSVSLPSQSMVDDRFPRLRRSPPMHQSGVGFVDVLDKFAKRTARIAAELPKDRGGPRRKKAFDDLFDGLEEYHKQLVSHGRLDSNDHFPDFRAAVIDVLDRIKSKLPSAPFKLASKDDGALRKRSNRNAKHRRPAKKPQAQT